jgi:hypothetical protein
MRLRPMNMAIQPAARRPQVFMELLFCSLRNTSCRTKKSGVRTLRGSPADRVATEGAVLTQELNRL